MTQIQQNTLDSYNWLKGKIIESAGKLDSLKTMTAISSNINEEGLEEEVEKHEIAHRELAGRLNSELRNLKKLNLVGEDFTI